MDKKLEFLIALWKLTKGNKGFKTWSSVPFYSENKNFTSIIREMYWVVLDKETGLWKWDLNKPTKSLVNILNVEIHLKKNKKNKGVKLNKSKVNITRSKVTGQLIVSNPLKKDNDVEESIKNPNTKLSELNDALNIGKTQSESINYVNQSKSNGIGKTDKTLLSTDWIKENVLDPDAKDVLTNAILSPNPNTCNDFGNCLLGNPIIDKELIDAITNINNTSIDEAEVAGQTVYFNDILRDNEKIEMPYNLEKDIHDVLLNDIEEAIKNKHKNNIVNELNIAKQEVLKLQFIIDAERSLDKEIVEHLRDKIISIDSINVKLTEEIENLKQYNNTLEFDIEQSKLSHTESINELNIFVKNLYIQIDENNNMIKMLLTNLGNAEGQLTLVAKLLKDANTELYKIKSSKLYKIQQWFRDMKF